MTSTGYKTILVMVILVATVFCHAADKYAGEIFSLGAGVRSFALGNTGVTDSLNAALAYWNPALLSRQHQLRIEVMSAHEFGGDLQYHLLAASWGGSVPVSFALAIAGIDDVPLTRLTDPDLPVSEDNPPVVYKRVNNRDVILYTGICHDLGGWPVGFTLKTAYRDLAEETGYGFGGDLSTWYKPARAWLIGARLRDFFTTQILWDNGTHETVNPALDLEAETRFPFPFILRQARLIGRVECMFEGREETATVGLGTASLDFHAGLAIDLHPNLDIYLGYDIEFITGGLTISWDEWRLHYSMEQNPDLNASHRVSIGYDMGWKQ